MSRGATSSRSGCRCSGDISSGTIATTCRATTTFFQSTAAFPTGVALVNLTSPLAGWTARLNHNLGIYGQDQWSLRRLTLGLGIRFDFQNESVDAYHYGPGPWLPNRNIDVAEIKNVPNWKDVD